jgi:excisionase family DNA binding protein
VRQILKSRSRRDEAVRLREKGLTYLEIGRKFGITKERVRQIIKGNPPRRPVPDRAKVMLTISDAAQLLGVHPNTARRWSDRGLIRAYRITSRGDRRFKRKDVDAFLRERSGTG